MCGSPGLTTRQPDHQAAHFTPLGLRFLPGCSCASPRVMEDKLYVSGFQQPKRTDATDRMGRLEDLRSLGYTLCPPLSAYTWCQS